LKSGKKHFFLKIRLIYQLVSLKYPKQCSILINVYQSPFSANYRRKIVMRKAVFFTLLMFILALLSCDNFFGKSWGSHRSYDPAKINVTGANVDEWIRASFGNPVLAKAVSQAILKKLPKITNPVEKAKLLEAGLRLAVDSSGLGESILTAGTKSLKDLDFDDVDENTIKELLEDILKDFESKGGPKSADIIGAMVSGFIATSGDYPIFDGYPDNFQAGDVAEAILVLALAQMSDADDFDINDWESISDLNPGLSTDGTHIFVDDLDDANLVALAAYLNLIIDNPDKYNDNPLTEAIGNASFFN